MRKPEFCRLVSGEICTIFSDNTAMETLDVFPSSMCDDNTGEYDAENITTMEVPYKKIAQRSFDRDEVINHYDWLEKNLDGIWKALFDKGLSESGNAGIIVAHGDKCYQYRDKLKSAGVPFHHGVAIYLLSYVKPYADEVRETDHGFVKPIDWVMDNYRRFKEDLPRY